MPKFAVLASLLLCISCSQAVAINHIASASLAEADAGSNRTLLLGTYHSFDFLENVNRGIVAARKAYPRLVPTQIYARPHKVLNRPPQGYDSLDYFQQIQLLFTEQSYPPVPALARPPQPSASVSPSAAYFEIVSSYAWGAWNLPVESSAYCLPDPHPEAPPTSVVDCTNIRLSPNSIRISPEEAFHIINLSFPGQITAFIIKHEIARVPADPPVDCYVQPCYFAFLSSMPGNRVVVLGAVDRRMGIKPHEPTWPPPGVEF